MHDRPGIKLTHLPVVGAWSRAATSRRAASGVLVNPKNETEPQRKATEIRDDPSSHLRANAI